MRPSRTAAYGTTGASPWDAGLPGAPAVTPQVAADVSTVLQAVVRGDQVAPGRPAAGKTGTQQWGNTKDNQDAWMAGYTPDLATAVWIGKAVPGPLRDAHGAAIAGNTIPADLWRDFTRSALLGRPPTPLPLPAHVGSATVGDAGQTHDDNPDAVAKLHSAETGYEPVVHT